jgi:hypothetical protein
VPVTQPLAKFINSLNIGALQVPILHKYPIVQVPQFCACPQIVCTPHEYPKLEQVSSQTVTVMLGKLV